MKCTLCGCRYQGVTRNKGKKRLDGTRVKTFYYGCGGYITKGTNVCQMNAISKDVLEQKVINKLLEFYRPYLEKDGRTILANAVKMQVNYEGKELINARKRAQTELEKIGHTINNLLDNITPINREYVDQRLNELKQKKLHLDARLEELERLSLSQDEIDNIVSDAVQFLSGLEFTFSQDLPQEKLVALRQCIEKIFIDKPAGIIKMIIRLVPVGNLEATEELIIRV